MADLSAGTLTDTERKSDDVRLQMFEQRLEQRRWIFCIGASVACMLVLFFLYFAFNTIRLIEMGHAKDVAWQIVAIGSVTLLSSITMLISLARFAYGQQSDKQADDDDLKLPQLEAIKSVVEITKALKAND